jgi:predicted nuclease of predicted toxin-antitoxin system
VKAAIRLLLDEDVRPLLAEILRGRGFDVIHVLEVGRAARSDADQLEFAAAQKRSILTHNVRDFVVLDREWKSKGRRHHGIIASDQIPFGELLRRTLRCLSRLDDEAIVDRFVWLHDFK